MTIVASLPPLPPLLEKQLATQKKTLQLMTTIQLLNQRVLEIVEHTKTTFHHPETLPLETLHQEIRPLEIPHLDNEIEIEIEILHPDNKTVETEVTEIGATETFVTQSLQDQNHENTTTTTKKTTLQNLVGVAREEKIL